MQLPVDCGVMIVVAYIEAITMGWRVEWTMCHAGKHEEGRLSFIDTRAYCCVLLSSAVLSPHRSLLYRVPSDADRV